MLRRDPGHPTADRHPSQPLPDSRLWSNREFLLLWGGRSVSALGSSASAIAFPLLILGLTHSAALAGLAGGVGALPSALLGLPAGVVVDRVDPKRLMIACDATRTLALVSIPVAFWLGHLTLVQLYAVVVLGGAMLVFYNTAVLAVIPRLVPERQLAASSAQYEGSFYLASLLGPSLGGILYAAGRVLPFLLDAASYVLSIVSLLLLRKDLRRTEPVQASSLRTDARAGMAWFWRHRLIRSISLIEGGEVILISGTPLLVIVLARSQHASSASSGLALSIGAVGGVLGAISAGPVQRLLGFAPIMIGVQWARVVMYPLYLIAPSPVLLGVITAAIYFLNPVRNVSLFRYVVPLIPDHLRGRILALWDLIPSTTGVVGAPLVGIGLQSLGGSGTVISMASAALVLAVLMMLNPTIRE